MSSSLDCLDLCRLCLIKDRVSVPIFEDEGDVRQIFLKITACLPVKVSRDDKLPKKICDDCVYKVELFYQFWNTTANAEKQLLQWLGEVDLEDKQTYVTEVLDTNVMKQEQNSDNRLEGNVIQVSGHQNNMDIGMIEDMTIMTIPAGSEQQFTTVPMDTSGTVQTVQAVPGPSTHDQMGQSQTHLVTEEVEESEEEENSDDGCDNEEGLPVKEETEEVQTETFVNVPISCDEAGPSGLQQQKVTEMSEMSMTQTATDGDPKTGLKTTLRRARARKSFINSSPIKIEPMQRSRRANVKSRFAQTQSLENPTRLSKRRRNVNVPLKKFKLEDNEDSIEIDIEAIKDEIVYFCDKCNVTFNSLQELKEHDKDHKICCDHCELSFRNRKLLRKHISEDHKTIPKFVCSECHSIFKCRQSLREHFVRKHTEDYRFVCGTCGKKFKMKSDLYMHVQSIHSDERGAVCDVCGKTYRNGFALKKHLAHAHNQRQFACDICKRKLATKESLEHHAMLHLRKERAVCQICGKTFSGNDALKKHMRIHTGDRPFPCKICGKTFRRQNTHKQHLLTHTGQRPYVCDVCGKSFTQKPGLITHRKKHPGPLPPLAPVSIDYVLGDLMQLDKVEKVINPLC